MDSINKEQSCRYIWSQSENIVCNQAITVTCSVCFRITLIKASDYHFPDIQDYKYSQVKP